LADVAGSFGSESTGVVLLAAGSCTTATPDAGDVLATSVADSGLGVASPTLLHAVWSAQRRAFDFWNGDVSASKLTFIPPLLAVGLCTTPAIGEGTPATIGMLGSGVDADKSTAAPAVTSVAGRLALRHALAFRSGVVSASKLRFTPPLLTAGLRPTSRLDEGSSAAVISGTDAGRRLGLLASEGVSAALRRTLDHWNGDASVSKVGDLPSLAKGAIKASKLDALVPRCRRGDRWASRLVEAVADVGRGGAAWGSMSLTIVLNF